MIERICQHTVFVSNFQIFSQVFPSNEIDLPSSDDNLIIMKRYLTTLLIGLIVFSLPNVAVAYETSLPNCPATGPKNNCFGEFVFGDGTQYIGEIQGNKMTGHGKVIFGDNKFKGDFYEGEVKNGQHHGFGTYKYSNGSVYVGYFRKNKRHGLGIMKHTFDGGGVSEGVWEDGQFIYSKPVEFDASTEQDDKKNENGTAVKKPFKNSADIISASSGSGFAVSADGFIMTNNHVIDGCRKVFIHTSGKQIPAAIVTYDQQNDLALLKADFRPEAVFPLSSKRPEILQDIYVAGYPFGMNVSTSVKVTKGIIS